MGVGSTGIPDADQPMRPIDANVVFVAEHLGGKVGRLQSLGGVDLLYLGLGVPDRPSPGSRGRSAPHQSASRPYRPRKTEPSKIKNLPRRRSAFLRWLARIGILGL